MQAHKPNQPNQTSDQSKKQVQQQDNQSQQQRSAKDQKKPRVDYVNSYQPPKDQSAQDAKKESESTKAQQNQNQTRSKSDSMPAKSKQNQSSAQPKSNPADLDQTGVNSAKEQNSAQSLEEQNIFDLLGVDDGDEEEKEQFLDELQQVIWEDFLENDLDLLVTSEEKKDIDQILNNNDLDDFAKQDQVIEYLDGLIPDLEEIMLEKALELKEELVYERVEAMKDFYAEDEETQQKIEQAIKKFAQNQWASGAELLNQISA